MRLRIAVTVIACALAIGAIGPARAASVGFETHLTATTDPLTVKGIFVIIEASDDERMSVSAPQFAVNDDLPTPDLGDVCVVAQSERSKRRMRTVITETACPGRMRGFSYDPTAQTLTIKGGVTAKLWTRVWRVVGNRLTLVTNKTTRSSVLIDVRWVRAAQPTYDPTGCGFGPGIIRRSVTDVEGSVRFKGLKLTVALPAGARGEISHIACASLNPL